AVLAFRWWGGTDTLPPRQGRGHPDLQAAGVRGRPGRPGRACQGTEPAGAGIGHAWACSGRDGRCKRVAGIGVQPAEAGANIRAAVAAVVADPGDGADGHALARHHAEPGSVPGTIVSPSGQIAALLANPAVGKRGVYRV